jgi:hypothetical protein
MCRFEDQRAEFLGLTVATTDGCSISLLAIESQWAGGQGNEKDVVIAATFSVGILARSTARQGLINIRASARRRGSWEKKKSKATIEAAYRCVFQETSGQVL